MNRHEQLGEIVDLLGDGRPLPNLVVWYVSDEALRERCTAADQGHRCARSACWFVGVLWGEKEGDGDDDTDSGYWRFGDYCATHWAAEFLKWSDRIAPES